MAVELGKIEKPGVEHFEGERKLYIVSLLFAGKDSPEEYLEKFTRYWQHVGEHIANQESKIGKVTRIYHESISLGGEDGLEVMEKLNASSCLIASEKCREGAVLEATELADLANECIDWERCLLMGFISQKVAQVVSEQYREALKKKYEFIAHRIDETLKSNEVAILFIREGHMVQFPKDIEVFSVAPPVLDEIYRWLRDRSAQDTEAVDEKDEKEES